MSSYIDQMQAADGVTIPFKTSHATVMEDTVGQGAEVRYSAQMLMGGVHPGFVVGNYYFTPGKFVSGTAAAVAANTLYTQPMPFGIQLCDTLAMDCTITASGNARMGLYKYDYTTGLPGALIIDAGAVALTVAIKEFAFAQRVIGNCWIASVFDQASTLRTGGTGSSGTWFGSGDFQTARNGRSVAQVYGPLPDPFPAGSTLSSIPPLMAMKRAV